MRTRTYIAMFISLMVNAVLFGIGAIVVLSIDKLSSEATVLLPLVVLVSFAISPFVSYWIAPRLRLKHNTYNHR